MTYLIIHAVLGLISAGYTINKYPSTNVTDVILCVVLGPVGFGVMIADFEKGFSARAPESTTLPSAESTTDTSPESP